MNKGSCLCGAVQYVANGGLGGAVFCHCTRCRKASGSAFGAVAAIEEDKFEVIQGRENLKDFVTPEGVHRLFCSICGSPIVGKKDGLPGVLRLRLGSLDSPAESPKAHIFAASKADWFEIHDSLPQFAERP
jgi:hypothetical protein